MTDNPAYLRRYTSIAAAIDILARGELPLLNPETWDDRNDRRFMEAYRKAKKPTGSLYGLCAAGCAETYHHWRVFTSAADGACIEIRRAPMEAALRGMPEVRFGFMEYLKLDEVDGLSPLDLERLPFVKRHGFKPENEYRIILESDLPQTSALSIEFPRDWIGRIYLNPWLPATLAETMIGMMRAVPGCEALSVQRSSLIENERWKRASERVSGLAPPLRKVIRLKNRP